MNNKNISPLYIYVERALAVGRLNLRTLNIMHDALDNVITNCCTTSHKVSKNSFLNTFFILLNGMNKKVSLNKFKAIKQIVDAQIACCTP